MRESAARPMTARKAGPLTGTVQAPGDKSISHRALIIGALAVGESRVEGLLEGEDVLRAAAAMRALGAEAARDETGVWRIHGCGVGGLREPDRVLDMGNSGTAARLLMGLAATCDMTTFFSGDASLNGRPMARVADPLARFGARFHLRAGGRLPGCVIGAAAPIPIVYTPPVASAQVKSAVLLAGLNAPGETSVIEPRPTRDHTERMLRHFGAQVRETADEGGAVRITVVGQPELRPAHVAAPADPSSAAFPAVAAALIAGSEVRLPGVGLNPRRDGLYHTLREMGADIVEENRREAGGEAVADLVVRGGALRGVDVAPERAPSMIDEYPILAVAAACAEGTTRMRGLGELRVKESDRLAGAAEGLAACGVAVEVEGDDLIVRGDGRPPRGGATVASRLDHRIAMSFLVLGCISDEPIAIDDGAPIATSFPGFVELMNKLGARIGASEA